MWSSGIPKLVITFLLAIRISVGVSVANSKRSRSTFNIPFQLQYAKGNASTRSGVISTRDSDDLLIPITHATYFYVSEFYLGSNRQHITALVDTGSSDTWIPGINVQCSIECKGYGTFDQSTSTSFELTSEQFNVTYLDLRHTLGDYGADVFSFNADGSNILKNFTFGIASETSDPIPVLGIGLKELEQTVDPKYKYDNLPILLKQQGYINKVAYSVYLNLLEDGEGNVLFGGYDRAKIDGEFTKLPITWSDRLNIDLDSISYNGRLFGNKVSATADSGFTYTTLLKENFQAIGEAVGGKLQYGQDGNFYLVDCDGYEGQSLTFHFGSATIDVPFTDLLGSNGDGTCTLLIFESDQITSLGDNLLRHAYLFYDLEDRTISIGKVKYTKETDIVIV